MDKHTKEDSYYGMSFKEYIEIIEDIGFELCLIIEFPYLDLKKKIFEKFCIYWHSEYAILLVFDTYYNSTIINGGHFYYNWKPTNRMYYTKYVSSGSFIENFVPFDELIWSGNHDCREEIRSNILNLRKCGTFLNPWCKSPSLWLLSYKDHHDVFTYKLETIDDIVEERLKMLPDYVQKVIKSEEYIKENRERNLNVNQKNSNTEIPYHVQFEDRNRDTKWD